MTTVLGPSTGGRVYEAGPRARSTGKVYVHELSNLYLKLEVTKKQHATWCLAVVAFFVPP